MSYFSNNFSCCWNTELRFWFAGVVCSTQLGLWTHRTCVLTCSHKNVLTTKQRCSWTSQIISKCYLLPLKTFTSDLIVDKRLWMTEIHIYKILQGHTKPHHWNFGFGFGGDYFLFLTVCQGNQVSMICPQICDLHPEINVISLFGTIYIT